MSKYIFFTGMGKGYGHVRRAEASHLLMMGEWEIC